MLLNLHTHLLNKQAGEEIILNQIIPDSEEALANFALPDTPNWLSAGIHPWYIHEKLYPQQLKKLAYLAADPAVKLIGECGLDRLKGAPLPLQEEVFIKQIRIAEEHRKALIIHCVRCFNELISIRKIVRPRVPMIVHGFNNKIEIARQLIEKGFYLSLGGAVLSEESNAVKILQEMPLENLFLETDDKEIHISDIYQKVSEMKRISIDELEKIIFDNYLTITSLQ
ncbi:TatD family hydrolase [Emticicia sp. TH156]|uniref:TatD family hydrolase n=1 Tax=Emticicia sp. TH156 TaxID=2067454 RepID=UPI001180891A|nr:TatD family hydrolase [Emticicia sp. TH156]